MKKKSLKINFLWAFLGNAVSAFCMWLLLILLAKMASVVTVGDFGIAQAVGLPISMLFSLKLQLAQVTDAKNEFDFGHYFALKVITSILAILVISVVGFIAYDFNAAVVITVLGMGYGITEAREIFLSVFQKNERMDLMAGSRIIQGLLSLFLFGVLFWLTQNLAIAITGLIAARITVLLSYDVPFIRVLMCNKGGTQHIVPTWDLKKLWKLAKTTSPLGLVAWLGTLFTSLPRLFLDKFSSREEVGYFTAMSSLLVAGTMIVSALVQAVSPRLSKYYAEDIKAYKVLLLKLILVGIGLGITGIFAAVFAGKWILTILFRPEYAQYNHVFIVLVMAGFLLIFFYFMNIGLTAARKFVIQVPLYAACAIVCCISSLCLIPKYGMIGASFSLICCYSTGLFGCAYYVRKAMEAKKKELFVKID